jgi:hypothetical protein
MLASKPLTMPKILGGEARGRKKVRMATKWDNRTNTDLDEDHDFIDVKMNFKCVAFYKIETTYQLIKDRASSP